MPGLQIQFEAVDQASPTIQNLAQMFMNLAQNGDRLATEIYNQGDKINTSLKKVQPAAKEAGDSLDKFRKSSTDLVGQLLGITSVVGVLGFFKSAADEAIRGEEAMRRLQFAVDSTGGSFEKSKDHITAFADQQQSLTQFSQTQTYEAMTRLVRITGDVGQAMQATRLVFGMASASGKDFNSIMDLLSPILQGDATRLRGLQSEFGAFIGPASTAQEVLDALSKKFLGVAEHQTGFAVEIQKSKNSLSEFQEKVGQGVLPAFSVLLKAGEAVAKFFEELAVGFAMDAAKIVEVFKFLFGSLQDFSLDGLKSRFNEFTNNWVSINQAAGQQIAEIEKRYSKERIDIQQDEERIKAGLRHKSLEEIKAEQEERRKLEAESSQLINKLEADLATQQKKDFESRMDYSNAEKKDLAARLKLIENEQDERVHKLDEYYRKGILTEDELTKAYANSVEVVKLKSKEAREATNADFEAEKAAAKQVGEQFASSIGGAFADIIVDGKNMQEAFDAVFKSVLKTAIETFTRIAIEAAVLRGSTEGLGMLGGIGIVAAIGGGAFKGIHLAEGGIVRKPTIAQVAESGPEAVIPLNKLGDFDQPPAPSTNNVTVNVTQNNTISIQGVDDDQVREVMRRISQATRNGAAEGAELVKSIFSKENRYAKEAV